MTDRVVKVALPIDLIKRMDRALAGGQAGMETRAEFIREATENLLTEISFPAAPPEPARAIGRETRGDDQARGLASSEQTDVAPVPADALASIPPWEIEELRLADLAGTALPPAPPGATLDDGVAEPDDEPLLGLHNRDYPSLWAASRLARYSMDSLPSFEDFRRQATDAAWFYALQLGALEKERRGTRLRALFPSNPQKREAAERGFQAFAIGSISRRPPTTGQIPADGPFFLWRLCQLARKDGELVVGLTSAGRSLLDRLTGLSLELPHNQASARAFLAYVSEVAPGDKWGFDQVVTAVAEGPDRKQLVTLISGERSDWSPATSSSIAQGYVARAREWGLIEPRLQSGKYRLTEFGKNWLREDGRG
jgi:hypothetical protein